MKIACPCCCGCGEVDDPYRDRSAPGRAILDALRDLVTLQWNTMHRCDAFGDVLAALENGVIQSVNEGGATAVEAEAIRAAVVALAADVVTREDAVKIRRIFIEAGYGALAAFADMKDERDNPGATHQEGTVKHPLERSDQCESQ